MEISSDPKSSTIFLDRDGQRFRCCLDIMRDGRVALPVSVAKEALLQDLKYYGLNDVDPDVISTTDSTLASLKQVANLTVSHNQKMQNYKEAVHDLEQNYKKVVHGLEQNYQKAVLDCERRKRDCERRKCIEEFAYACFMRFIKEATNGGGSEVSILFNKSSESFHNRDLVFKLLIFSPPVTPTEKVLVECFATYGLRCPCWGSVDSFGRCRVTVGPLH
jgi:hypothetical protein